MIDKIIDKLRGLNIAILGFGREGKATYAFIRKYLGEQMLTIIDKNDVSDNKEVQGDKNVKFISGDNYLDRLDIYDYVIKTPGISLKEIDTENVNITSEIELLLEVARDRVIGVTGTKGKSTTSSLIYNIILDTGKPVVFAGNIGVPVFAMLDEIDDDTLIVVEMSSHQLEYLNVSPHIGVVLNLFEDHLDHAGSVKHYHEIKMKMFLNQTSDDYMIYCSDNEALNELVKQYDFKGKKCSVNRNGDENATVYLSDGNVYYEREVVFDENIKRNILGEHNFANIMVSYAVGRILNINSEDIIKSVEKFKPLEYRLEHFADIGDVAYYVDTLATIPSATLEAIKAIPNVSTLIFGGMDRGISYEGFAEELTKSNVKHFICMPTTGHKIGRELPEDRTYFVDTLEEACEVAKRVSEPHTACVLSPAAASYEHFKNYQEKGDKFKEYIKK